MRSTIGFHWLGILALGGLAVLAGCADATGVVTPPATGSGGSMGGSVGSGGASGSGGTIGAGTGGAPAGTGGSGADRDGSPELGPSPEVSADLPPPSGIWAQLGIEDLTTVKKTSGCGMDPGQALGSFVPFTVTITPKPVRGTGNRNYFIKLPPNYDNNKPYRLIFEGPGCGGTGTGVFDYAGPAGAEGVIQIGLSPEPGVWMAGCFDDKRTDSIEYKFLETVHDIASKRLCIDDHRVFVSGHSSGSWLTNMMGCVYGSKMIRAIAPNSGGLATGNGTAPPCTELPTPGIWSHNETDPTNPFVGSRTAITRALRVNKCTGTFDNSPRAAYDAMPAGVCEQFTSCPKEFPIVLCHPKSGVHNDNLGPVPARAWQFFKQF